MARIASNNPDMMKGGGGLTDDFDAVISNPRYTVVRSKRTDRVDSIAVRATLVFSDEFAQKFGKESTDAYWFCGGVDTFVPANGDINDPVPVNLESDELDGVYALAVGDYDDIWGGSDWKFFLNKSADAGLRELFNPDVRFLDGISAHFKRFDKPQRARRGVVVGDDGTGTGAANEPKPGILCITDIYEKPSASKGASAKKSAAKSSAPSAAKSAPATATTKGSTNGAIAAPTNSADFDDQLTEHIVNALATADNNALDLKAMTTAVIANYSPADKAKAMKRMKEEDYLDAAVGFTYSEDERVFTLG